MDGDGCDTNCTSPDCGNGVVVPPEECDDGNNDEDDGCDPNCRWPRCGNGFVGGIESCDDGNAISGDGCDSLCRAEVCGNAVTQADEECDDGNATNGDFCDDNCTVPRCGNSAIAAADGEECDDGNLVNGDVCDNNCTLPRCGNAQVAVATEECDLGDAANGNAPADTCRADCTQGCGDGAVDAWEQCDGGAGCNGCRWGTEVCVTVSGGTTECYLDIDTLAHGAPERTPPPATGASATDPYLQDVDWSCADTVDTDNSGDRGTICGVAMSVDTSVSGVIVYTMRSLEVLAGADVRFIGSRNIALAVYGDVSIAAGARLGVDGSGSQNGAGARSDCGPQQGGNSDGGGAGGSHGSRGGNGGDGDDQNGSNSGTANTSDPHVWLERGCRGGHGGDGSAQAPGGGAGGALQISAGGSLLVDGVLSANGGAGTRPGDSDGGGAGGGSGGDLYLQAVRVVVGGTGAVVAQGGSGSGGGDGGDGEPGPTVPSLRALGGSDGGTTETAGGDGAGAASDGTLEAATQGVDDTGPGGDFGAGGGGGGAGRVSMDLVAACPAGAQARFSPQPICR